MVVMNTAFSGGAASGYLLLYLTFVISFAAGIAIYKNSILFGGLAGLFGHFMIMFLGLANAIPMPTVYYVVGNFIGVILVAAMYWAWKNGT